MLLLSTAAPAQESIRAAVYPIAGSGVSSADVSDAQMLLDVSLVRQRTGIVRSGETLRPSCGDARTAQVSCLAKLAGSGVVLRGVLRRARGGRFLLDLSAIDGAARVFGPVQVPLDASLTDARGLVDAIATLGSADAQDEQVRRMAARPAAVAPAPAAPSSPAAASKSPARTPVAPAPVPTRVTRVPAAAVASAAPAGPPGAWMEPTGIWLLAGGTALAAGGAVFGFLGQKLDQDLSAKYAAHTLAAADLPSYGAAHRDALLANMLLVAGGALAVTGCVLWGLAPDVADNSFGVAGRF